MGGIGHARRPSVPVRVASPGPPLGTAGRGAREHAPEPVNNQANGAESSGRRAILLETMSISTFWPDRESCAAAVLSKYCGKWSCAG
jgi:hypothetical protein